MKKLERTKNAYRNILTGTALKLFQVLMPFVVRTVFIYTLGIDYLGLNSLFTSILQVLNLSELGVGSAMVFSMYKPIAESDNKTICALMNLYRRYYNIIGFVILTAGLAITPFLDRLISGDIPGDVNIYILYLINLLATVVSYWLFAYENSLLTAHQRNDVSSVVTLVTSIIQYGLQLLVLITLTNYYAYVVVMPLMQIVTNISTAAIAKKMYPQYRPEGRLEKKKVREINGKIKDLFTSKVGSVVLNSADSIVISAFLGLRLLAIYNNYYYILSAVIGFITVIQQSVLAGVGNSFVTETKEKNYNDFKKFTFMYLWLIAICTCCFLNLYQPFMMLWVGKDNMLTFQAVIMMCIYFYVFEFNGLLNMYKDATGIWHQDRFRPLVVAVTNLVVNIILVQFIGIYGIIFSTVFSILFIGLPWVTTNVFHYVFSGYSIRSYIAWVLPHIAITLGACVISYFLCRGLGGGIGFLLTRLIISAFIPCLLYGLFFKKTSEFGYLKNTIKKLMHRS